MSKSADARRARSAIATIPGGPQAYPSNGSLVPTAPKHRAVHQKATAKLRPFTDYMPAPEMRLPGVHWSKPQDRDWRGVGVGCYHGTSHNGKAILCEGESCKFAPRDHTTRSNPTNGPQRSGDGPMDPVRAHLARIGYPGPITPLIRRLVLDDITFQSQVALMAEG